MAKFKTPKRLTLAAVAVLTVLSGCKTIGPGVSYNFVTLDAMISATPEEITDAAKMVIEEMKLIMVSAEATGLDGQVVARTARQKTVRITTTRQAKNISLVKIQVGKLGDEGTSILILDRIKERL